MSYACYSNPGWLNVNNERISLTAPPHSSSISKFSEYKSFLISYLITFRNHPDGITIRVSGNVDRKWEHMIVSWDGMNVRGTFHWDEITGSKPKEKFCARDHKSQWNRMRHARERKSEGKSNVSRCCKSYRCNKWIIYDWNHRFLHIYWLGDINPESQKYIIYF